MNKYILLKKGYLEMFEEIIKINKEFSLIDKNWD